MPKERKISVIKNTHQAFEFMLILAQCFAMFPVCGISAENYKSLRFKLASFRSIYSMFYMFLLFLNAALYVVKILTSSLKFGYFGKISRSF